MKFAVSSFLAGLLFSLGLWISGMTDPDKVQGFLSIFHEWDPTLMFVMMGAIGVHSISYVVIRKRQSPLFDTKFFVPNNTKIDKKLLLGAVIFGVGWGLAGYCPGPIVASLASMSHEVWIIFLSMLVGIFGYHKVAVKG